MSEQIKQKISNLTKLINGYNYNYYTLSKSKISDYQFDKLMEELESLEKRYPQYLSKNSPSQKVGGEVLKNFKTIRHNSPMLSLSNSYSKDDVLDFDARVKKITSAPFEYVCELKYDGLAISLIYENQKLKQAITRGDGLKGDDVSVNIKTINNVPIILNKLLTNTPSYLEVRGEIFMHKSEFQKINNARAVKNLEKLANPRNTASGTIRMKDSKEVAKRKLNAMIYSVTSKVKGVDSHYQSLTLANNLGFNTPIDYENFIKVCKDSNEVFEFINYWDNKRDELDFEIDGIVIKVNQFNIQEELGYTAKNPKWAIAYKFKTEQTFTRLLNVDFQVGRTGAITPVANLEPILIGGTIVKRASLHNNDQIEKLDLRINDIVIIEKGGEIIPKIVGVKKHEEKSPTVKFPKKCPSCSSLLEKQDGVAQHYCTNQFNCLKQILGKAQHFISKKAMDIESLGGETIALFYHKGLIKSVADIYKLKEEDLKYVERFAEKSTKNILQAIEQSKNIPFERVLFALGIKNVGETLAKKLAIHFKDINNLIKASLDELISVQDIGQVVAEGIIEYFSNKVNQELINQLASFGLQFKINEKVSLKASNKLKDLTFVVTGVFEGFSREDAKKLIEDNGGKVTTSITSKTNYLLFGKGAGPKKTVKAEQLKVKILKENELKTMLSV